MQIRRDVRMELYGGFESSSNAWTKEANIWATLYLIYDTNIDHMMNAFQSNGLWNKSADELHKENLKFTKELEDRLDKEQKHALENVLYPNFSCGEC